MKLNPQIISAAKTIIDMSLMADDFEGAAKAIDTFKAANPNDQSFAAVGALMAFLTGDTALEEKINKHMVKSQLEEG